MLSFKYTTQSRLHKFERMKCLLTYALVNIYWYLLMLLLSFIDRSAMMLPGSSTAFKSLAKATVTTKNGCLIQNRKIPLRCIIKTTEVFITSQHYGLTPPYIEIRIFKQQTIRVCVKLLFIQRRYSLNVVLNLLVRVTIMLLRYCLTKQKGNLQSEISSKRQGLPATYLSNRAWCNTWNIKIWFSWGRCYLRSFSSIVMSLR